MVAKSHQSQTKFTRPELVRQQTYCIGAPEAENLLIHGENLEALSILEEDYTGKIKAIYIDPPYNNSETYTHYDDDLGHLEWIQEISPRLEVLWRLLREDGSLWISIDDNEVHYLKVAADRIFGRHSFITTIIWQHRNTRENRNVFSNNHEYILVYAKSPTQFQKTRNLLPLNAEVMERYKNPDNDPRGAWQSISANVQAGHATPSQFYQLKAPNGKIHNPPAGRCWLYTKEKMLQEIAQNNIWFGKDGNGVPRLKKFLKEASRGLTPETLWMAADVGTSKSAKKNLLKTMPDVAIFDTPKPEQLLCRILQIATNPGDLVLDAYAGSGTTGVAACTMGRRFIGIERGDHALTHCLKRIGHALAACSSKAKRTWGINVCCLSSRKQAAASTIVRPRDQKNTRLIATKLCSSRR